MEFWEGAILVVGGIWLVGRMSRQSASHPANVAAPYMVSPSNDPSGGLDPTLATNTAGDSSITVGEPIGQPTTPLRPTRTPVTPRPCTTCYGNFPRPVAVGGGGHPTPVRVSAPVMSHPTIGSKTAVPHFGTAPVRGVGATATRGTTIAQRARFFTT